MQSSQAHIVDLPVVVVAVVQAAGRRHEWRGRVTSLPAAPASLPRAAAALLAAASRTTAVAVHNLQRSNHRPIAAGAGHCTNHKPNLLELDKELNGAATVRSEQHAAWKPDMLG